MTQNTKTGDQLYREAQETLSEAELDRLNTLIDQEQRNRLSGSPKALQRIFPSLNHGYVSHKGKHDTQ